MIGGTIRPGACPSLNSRPPMIGANLRGGALAETESRAGRQHQNWIGPTEPNQWRTLVGSASSISLGSGASGALMAQRFPGVLLTMHDANEQTAVSTSIKSRNKRKPFSIFPGDDLIRMLAIFFKTPVVQLFFRDRDFVVWPNVLFSYSEGSNSVPRSS